MADCELLARDKRNGSSEERTEANFVKALVVNMLLRGPQKFRGVESFNQEGKLKVK